MRFSSVIHMLLTAAAVATLTTNASAQTDYGKRKSTRLMSVGAGFAGGGSITTSDPPEGSKLAPIFAWRATADITYPLTPVISTALSLGLDSRGSENHLEDNKDSYIIGRVNYFTLTPAFQFSAFYLGLNIGFPMSGSVTSKASASAQEVTSDFSDATLEFYQMMLEPRIGAVIPIMDEEVGWLGLTIMGGYQVNEIIEKGEDHFASLHLGLTWQFGIPGTKRK